MLFFLTCEYLAFSFDCFKRKVKSRRYVSQWLDVSPMKANVKTTVNAAMSATSKKNISQDFFLKYKADILLRRQTLQFVQSMISFKYEIVYHYRIFPYM